MDPAIVTATNSDVAAITALKTAVANRLTQEFGHGHWSSCPTEKSVLRYIDSSRVLVARSRKKIIGTLRLATKKPWAIDTNYFTPVKRPLYLLDMAVDPKRQQQGIGRRLLDQARIVAQAWPAQAIRLDAYDAAAGAGDFYAKCGFREVGRVTYRGTPLIYFELLIACPT
jgi:GNAT superfamily N-acetyltransferase